MEAHHLKTLLWFASPYACLASLFVGHFVGRIVPERWVTNLETILSYHAMADALGTLSCVATFLGVAVLIGGRRWTPTIITGMSRADTLAWLGIGSAVALGVCGVAWAGILDFGSHGGAFDYRQNVATWFRDLDVLRLSALRSNVSIASRSRILLVFLLLAVRPFTFLSHVTASPARAWGRSHDQTRHRAYLSSANPLRRSRPSSSQSLDLNRT